MFRAEMRFCNEHGIPHSELLDWEPDDRAKMLGYMAYESSICSMCNTGRWEWDPKHGGSRFAYEPVEEICPGCEKKDWYRDNQDERRAGSFIILQPTEKKV